MSDTIRFNATKMFDHREPWDCSNSQANLGDQAGRLTWQCATEVAEAHARWLLTPLPEAVEAIRADAKGYGAWDAEEIAAWTDVECLALLVQFIASDLRLLGSDDHDLVECVEVQNATDWDKESEYPIASFYVEGSDVLGERYMGV